MRTWLFLALILLLVMSGCGSSWKNCPACGYHQSCLYPPGFYGAGESRCPNCGHQYIGYSVASQNEPSCHGSDCRLARARSGSGATTSGSASGSATLSSARREYNQALAAYNNALQELQAAQLVASTPDAISREGGNWRAVGQLSEAAKQQNVADARRKLEIARRRLSRAEDRLNNLERR